MKKWSILALLNRSNNDFTIKAREDNTEAYTTLCTSDQFKNKLKQKYWDFSFLTGSYNDPETGTVELAENVSQAVEMFNTAFNVWAEDRKIGFLKLFNALRSKYNPIWNVDGTERETIVRDLDTSDDILKNNTGDQTDTNTGTQTTNETGTDTTQNTGTVTTANSGTQATAHTGTETLDEDVLATMQTSPYDDNLFYNKEKTETDTDNTKTYNTADTRTDNLSELVTNALTDTETKNLQTQRTDNLTHKRTDDLHERTVGSGTEDEETTRTLTRQGNIGVTKTTDLIMSMVPLTEIDKIIDYMVSLFIQENCVI